MSPGSSVSAVSTESPPGADSALPGGGSRGSKKVSRRTPPGVLASIAGIVAKDLLVEWRARARIVGLASFALTMLLLFAFTVGPDIKTLRAHSGGYLWMTLLLASTLQLARAFQTEVEGGALDNLLLLPVPPVAIFYGKAIASTVQLGILALFTAPITFALTDSGLAEPVWLFLATVILGVAGLSAPGTLYAALTARLPARQLLLPLLLFPLIVPALLAAVKATTLALEGDPMEQIGSWLGLLLCFDLIYWSLCGVLFGKVVDR